MTVTSSDLDTGTGYGRPASRHDARLTEVGPGTPMGEALRRYWHPVASSSGLTSDLPHRVRILCEDLIVFRTRSGRPGVVFERCSHRGSSLFYGRIEEDGIRCCYHGWKFDVQGHCLEQACEPDRGRRRDVARQPWYPVEERYGLVFVYMGPPELKPPLPRYEFLEDLEEGEMYVSELPVPHGKVTGALIDFNWLQAFENAMDPVHATWLHYEHSGPQFDGVGTTGAPHSFYDPYSVSDKIEYFKTDHGVGYRQRYEVEQPDGSTVTRYWSPEVHVPNIILLPDFVKVVPDGRHDCVLFDVPVDDTHHRAFMTARTSDPDRLARITNSIKQNGKQPWELTEEEHQRYPADFEAQGSQGPVTQHSEETLATSDKGVVMLRRLLKQMVDDVEAGRTPQNVDLGEAKPRRTTAGHFTEGVTAPVTGS
ncbi:Rieske 2Fe-2S domain-containing protein [Streptomyces griseorubiginosus]|uniref:Rieske 2Fe-2S domain-containing protein n=1 Tax=Streptomyces griseorubiginosus TaxID=67304 RepID=UPI001AD6D072|nr:Rieske 2Fe-2S domain-containing protein [Streptomyces griseorubiginosus]MBO4253322.1 Rieske 2Fe-2S domain-containing protein [Streptomyces griseorubiginosus]